LGEKRGNTVKLVYDFNSARCCEIEYKPGKWIRTTVREFRSFDGNRRILNVDDPNNVFYEQYNGPVYLFDTNKKITPIHTNQIQFTETGDPRRFGQRRQYESF
jgi:hypothetical protein